MGKNTQSPQEEYTSIKGNHTTLSEDFILRAQEANRAPADHQPRMAMELLQEARNTLKSIHAVTTQPATPESRAVLATFQDKSTMSIRMVSQTLRAQNSKNPDQEAELTGPDGHPLSWRSLMENISSKDSVAHRILAAHNSTDSKALESAIQETKRHAVNIMCRLPLEYRDCFQEIHPQARTYQTTVFHDGSRIMWAFSHETKTSRDKPLAALSIPPDPRLSPGELKNHGSCSNCGGIAVQNVNAKRVQTNAYGMEVDEVFCLACTGGPEFASE